MTSRVISMNPITWLKEVLNYPMNFGNKNIRKPEGLLLFFIQLLTI